VALLTFLATLLRSRLALQLEIIALRHQVAVSQRSVSRPRLHATDRLFWVWLSRLWSGWQHALAFVQPRTVSTVEKYRVRHQKTPSPTWKAFLNNHVKDIVALDFFTVPTVTFRVLFVLIILAHERRRIVHFHVTEHPTAQWTAQQVVEAFPWADAPRYLLRDRDHIYGGSFQQRVHNMGIEEVLIAPQSPWQNPYAERVIGSIRRDVLDHVIVLHEQHLRRLLTAYLTYYHRFRTHLSLDMDCPEPRPVELPEAGEAMAIPEVGGLHHHYQRQAA
jgi:transposase InsO family protein